MEWVVIAGSLATIASLCSCFPQLIRLLRTGSIEGLSLTTVALGFATCSSWLTYGILKLDPAQITVNSVAAATGFILYMRTMDVAGYRRTTSATRGLLWVGVLLAFALAGSASVVGMMALVLSIASRLPQTLVSWRAPGGYGVSWLSNALTALGAGCWILYGTLQGDMFVVLSASWACGLSGFIALQAAKPRLLVEATDTEFAIEPVAA